MAKPKIGRSYLMCLLCACVFFLLSGCSAYATTNNRTWQGNRTETSSPVEQARRLLAQGNSTEAIRILTDHLQSHPGSIPARVTLGQAYAMSGQTDRAEAEFQSVLKTAPENYIALAALGELYYRAGQLEKAEPLLGKAAKLSRGAPQLRMEWAFALARLRRYKEAQAALADIPIPRDPEEQIALHRLKASVEVGLGNFSAAAREMEKALELRPEDSGLALATAAAQAQGKNWRRVAALAEPVFHRAHDPGAGLLLLEAQLGAKEDFHPTLQQLRSISLPAAEEVNFRQRLAELLISYGHYSESIDELQKAADLDPSRAGLLFNLALAQYRAGKLDDALASAEKCKALGDTAEIEDLFGDIQEARGDNLAAVRSYQAAIALSPQEEKYRLSLAVELMRHKSFEAASAVLKQAEQLHPDSWRIQLALGLVEHFAGTDEAASRIFLRAADMAPSPAPVLQYLGDIQMDQASAPDPAALAKLCQYADRHPDDGQMQLYCGGLLFRRDYTSGDKTHAEEILRRLRAAGRALAEGSSPHCQMEKVYRWLDRWNEALNESQVCVRLDPDSAEGHYRLAQIYQHMGKQEQAKAEMKLYETASKRMADENARRDETIKTFLYTIQKEPPDRK
jgi:tetratricopeptide (TPR) repeat protein